MRSLLSDESGFIVSAELVLIGTLVVLGMITGLVCLRSAVVDELASVGAALRGMNQSYYTPAFFGCRKWWGPTSYVGGSYYRDVNFAAYSFPAEIQGGAWGGTSSGVITTPNTGAAVIENRNVAPAVPAPIAEDCVPPAVTAPCDTCPPGTMLPGTVIPRGVMPGGVMPGAGPQSIGPDGRPEIPFGPSPQPLPQL
jgi:hypothetical protein